jgi:hypothetical protein
MELAVESDIYSPSIDDKGNYVDRIPSFNNIKNGLRCPCGTRKDKTYDCTTYFSNHIKTKSHQKWLSDMNTNKSNFFLENISLKDTINNQKQIIGKLEKEIQIKLKTIDYLTQQMTMKDANYNIVNNLLDFD